MRHSKIRAVSHQYALSQHRHLLTKRLENPFFQAMDAYLLTQAQQGKSPLTLGAYRRDLHQLALLLTLDTHQQPKRRDFVAALQRLSMNNQHPRSMMRKLSVWRRYCAYLVEQGHLPADPTLGLRAPKAPQHLPKALERETINHLLDTSTAPTDFLTARDHAMVELLYGSGLRLAELCALNIDDLHLDEAWVVVWGKGNKQRQIPLTPKSIAALNTYLQWHSHQSTALFIGRHGQRISHRQIAKRLQSWAQHHGSQQHISPHMLRHSYASHMLQASGDVRAVQELMGHSQVSTTQIYTKLDFDHLARVYDNAHPRAKRRK